jgi:hypothetical protein
VIELGYTGAPDVPQLASHFEPGPRFAGKLRDFMDYLKSLENQDSAWVIVSRQSSRLRNLWAEGQIYHGALAEEQLAEAIYRGHPGGRMDAKHA